MPNVTGKLALNTNFQQIASGIPSSQPVVATNGQTIQFNVTTSGDIADQIDLKYSAVTTLAAAPTVLDLTSLLDVFGGTINFKRVRSITIVNTATTDGFNVKLGYSTTTSNAWTAVVSNPGQIVIPSSTAINQGVFAVTAPNTTGYLVGSTSKLVNLDPGANTITVNIEITGCVA